MQANDIALLVPYFFLAFSWVAFENLFLVPKRSILTIAKVVGYKDSASGSSNTVRIYTPILEYTVNDETIKSNNSYSTNSKPYGVGDEVEVTYDPSNIKNVQIPNNKSQLLYIAYPFVCLLITILTIIEHGFSNVGAAIFIGLSLFLLFGVNKRHNKSKHQCPAGRTQ
jgi:hypothetical protein